ncbi:MAG: tetratricopeptide repeat protein [Pirellulaceae bacterium]
MRDRRKVHDRESETANEDGDIEPRPAVVPYGRLIVGLAAVAAAVGLSVVYLLPTGQEPNSPAGPEANAAAPEAAATDRRSAASDPSSRREPTIILPTAALFASAEQLQQETQRVAEELRSRFPSLAEALHVAAMMHAQLRQTAQAEKLWQQCIELSPENPQYYVNLAAVAMDRGDSEMAASTLQKAVDQASDSPDVLHHLGVALTNLGRSEEAERVLQQALAAYPDSPSHTLVLGQAQLKLGKAAEAEATLRRAIDLGSRSAAAYFALANACAQQGKDEAAAQYRQKYTELSAAQPIAAEQRFQVLSTAEARRTAVAILTEAAAVHAAQDDSLEAERLLLRALALDPANFAACRSLGDLYQAAGMAAEERVVRRRLVEIEPGRFENFFHLAQASAQLGEPESAEAALKLAISIRPEAAIGYTTLAQFYLESRRAPQARWYAQEAVRREPTAEGYILLASTCRLLDDPASAQAAFDMARQLDPTLPGLTPSGREPTSPPAESSPPKP